MQRDVRKWLEDISLHGAEAATFLEQRTLDDYLSDNMLRAAVERKLFIVGEAVAQIKNLFPAYAAKLPDTTAIVGFRNLLAHGYFALDHRRVYAIATSKLPELHASAVQLLQAAS